MDELADAEKILIERCENGWIATITLDNSNYTEKKVFEYFDNNYDDQLPTLVDLLSTISTRIGPYPKDATQKLSIKIQPIAIIKPSELTEEEQREADEIAKIDADSELSPEEVTAIENLGPIDNQATE